MATKNDITGDSLQSRAPTKAYADGWDRIFGNKDPEVWQHYCKNNGHMSIEKGQTCNWCGMKEDGTLD
jgi:hypothetical protein